MGRQQRTTPASTSSDVASAQEHSIINRFVELYYSKRFQPLLAYTWIGFLSISLLVSAYNAYRQSVQVREYAIGADRFGYLMTAKEIRHAVSHLRLPHFYLESDQTTLLINRMLSKGVPLALWKEMVAPHAHHYFPRAGHIGVQYPPGTGAELALFPQGKAVVRLNKTVVAVLFAFGILSLLMTVRHRAWLAAGFLAFATHLGLEIIGPIDSWSYSINAILVPLLLALLLGAVSLVLTENVRLAWIAAFLGGCFLGFAFLVRIPAVLLFPGFFLLFCPHAWEISLRNKIIPVAAGVLLAGVIPLFLFQHQVAGAWFLPTYGPADNSAPSLHWIKRNLNYYLGSGPGSTDNWSLVWCTVGFIAFVTYIYRLRLRQTGLSRLRLLSAALLMWGLPTVYFLCHQVTIPYYCIPSTFGSVLLIALGVFVIESGTTQYPQEKVTLAPGWRSVAFCIALAPGVISGWRSRPISKEALYPLEHRQRLTGLVPEELRQERAWIWSDLYSGAFWYYADKPAFKINFSERQTRLLVYQFVVDRREPQYLVWDSEAMKHVMDEISQLGGRLESKGTVDGNSYFLIHWSKRP